MCLSGLWWLSLGVENSTNATLTILIQAKRSVHVILFLKGHGWGHWGCWAFPGVATREAGMEFLGS